MGNKIFVGGLNWDATDDDLRESFGECGEITEAVIVNDRDTGRSRGFGFVTYSSDEEAKAAVEKFDGQDFMGRKLTVNEARQREDRGGGGGGGRGGGGRGGGGGGYRDRGDRGDRGGRRDNW
jgi:RNA recognition motif-containing protein